MVRRFSGFALAHLLEALWESEEAGPQTDDDRSAFQHIVRMQDLLCITLRRCIEDPEFGATFAEGARIRERWPISV